MTDALVRPESFDRAVSAVSPGARVTAADRIAASFSNSTYRVAFVGPDGLQGEVIVRLYTSPLGDPRRKARVEQHALQLLRRSPVPVAEPLLCDPTGEALGTPGIVTTVLEGRPVLDAGEAASWPRRVAQTLARIHETPLDAADKATLLDGNAEALWFLRHDDVPAPVAQHPLGRDVWDAVRTLRHSLPREPIALVHLDFWRGNLLWQGERITGVVDWEEAGLGDPAIDVAYCRADLCIGGFPQQASEFLDHYVRSAGRELRTLAFWELAASVRWLPDPGAEDDSQAAADRSRRNYDAFVDAALKRAR